MWFTPSIVILDLIDKWAKIYNKFSPAGHNKPACSRSHSKSANNNAQIIMLPTIMAILRNQVLVMPQWLKVLHWMIPSTTLRTRNPNITIINPYLYNNHPLILIQLPTTHLYYSIQSQLS